MDPEFLEQEADLAEWRGDFRTAEILAKEAERIRRRQEAEQHVPLEQEADQ